MADEKPPPPKLTPAPFQNGAPGPEPISSVFHPKTGRTRQRAVKWGAIFAASTALLTPIANAIALRIAPPPQSNQASRELRELYEIRRSLFRDGGQ